MRIRPRFEGMPGFRPETEDRKLLSLQDWYGFGVLAGLGLDEGPRGVSYAGKRATDDQFYMGWRHGQELAGEATKTSAILPRARRAHLP